MNGYTRRFMSIEQALQSAIQDLKRREVDFKKNTGRNEKYLRKCSDENDRDRNLSLKDAIQLDKTLLSNDSGTPLLKVYQAQIDEYIDSLHKTKKQADIKNILFDIHTACSKLITIVRESKDPKSDMGEEISNREKESIYKSIKEIEEQISAIKINIGPE